MQPTLLILVLAVVFSATSSWAETAAVASVDVMKKLENRASDVKTGKPSEYAPEALKEALTAVSAAQAAAASGNSKLLQQRIETANLLLTVSEAKAAERELLEKVAVQRVELKKLEAQLERNLQGEAKP